MSSAVEYVPGDAWLVAGSGAVALVSGAAGDAVRLWPLLGQIADGGLVLPEGYPAVVVAMPDGDVVRLLIGGGMRARLRLADAGSGEVLITGPEDGRADVRIADVVAVQLQTDDRAWVDSPEDLLPVRTGVVPAAVAQWRPASRAVVIGSDGSGSRRHRDSRPDVAGRPWSAAPVETLSVPVEAVAVPVEAPVPVAPPPAPVGVAVEPAVVPVEPIGPPVEIAPPVDGQAAAGAAESPPAGDAADLEVPPDDHEATVLELITAGPERGADSWADPVGSMPAAATGPAAVLPGDHDGMTQLAEDLPPGYRPPPLPPAPPAGHVLASRCPSGHPNAPLARNCRICGQPIPPNAPVPVPRPLLARLRLSTGELVDVDRPVVLGRAPVAGRAAAADLPRLVPLPSPNHDISRSHAEIRPEDWHLVLVDLNSTNGTVVRPPNRPPHRLAAGEHLAVDLGWRVELGDEATFEIVDPA